MRRQIYSNRTLTFHPHVTMRRRRRRRGRRTWIVIDNFNLCANYMQTNQCANTKAQPAIQLGYSLVGCWFVAEQLRDAPAPAPPAWSIGGTAVADSSAPRGVSFVRRCCPREEKQLPVIGGELAEDCVPGGGKSKMSCSTWRISRCIRSKRISRLFYTLSVIHLMLDNYFIHKSVGERLTTFHGNISHYFNEISSTTTTTEQRRGEECCRLGTGRDGDDVGPPGKRRRGNRETNGSFEDLLPCNMQRRKPRQKRRD